MVDCHREKPLARLCQTAPPLPPGGGFSASGSDYTATGRRPQNAPQGTPQEPQQEESHDQRPGMVPRGGLGGSQRLSASFRSNYTTLPQNGAGAAAGERWQSISSLLPVCTARGGCGWPLVGFCRHGVSVPGRRNQGSRGKQTTPCTLWQVTGKLPAS